MSAPGRYSGLAQPAAPSRTGAARRRASTTSTRRWRRRRCRGRGAAAARSPAAGTAAADPAGCTPPQASRVSTAGAPSVRRAPSPGSGKNGPLAFTASATSLRMADDDRLGEVARAGGELHVAVADDRRDRDDRGPPGSGTGPVRRVAPAREPRPGRGRRRRGGRTSTAAATTMALRAAGVHRRPPAATRRGWCWPSSTTPTESGVEALGVPADDAAVDAAGAPLPRAAEAVDDEVVGDVAEALEVLVHVLHRADLVVGLLGRVVVRRHRVVDDGEADPGRRRLVARSRSRRASTAPRPTTIAGGCPAGRWRRRPATTPKAPAGRRRAARRPAARAA